MKQMQQRFDAGLLTIDGVKQNLEIIEIMDWVPLVFVTFKVLVFGTCMFLAIKWHYEQGKKEKGKAKRGVVLRAGGKVAAVFALALLGLLLLTFGLSQILGVDYFP